MNKPEAIVSCASRVFDLNGFRGVGVDAVLAPSGASTRTLYKHFGSRDGLVLSVLVQRHSEFMERLKGSSAADEIGDLFIQLRIWLEERGARGCMLLRARSEYSEANPQIVETVRGQKEEFLAEIGLRVARTLGYQSALLTRQIWLLFEGATAAASVQDLHVIEDAELAASELLAAERERSK